MSNSHRCPELLPGWSTQVQCDRQVGHESFHTARHEGQWFRWRERPAAPDFYDFIRQHYLNDGNSTPVFNPETYVSDGTGSLQASFGHAEPRPRTLEDAVAEQLAAIHDSLPADWQGIVEIEPVPPELTDTYAAAHGSALKNCDHSRSSSSTLISRGQRQCDDCGRYFTRKSWLDL